MSKTRPPYPPEFRARMVELVRSGRSISELAREFEPSANSIRNWVKQSDLDDGRREDGLTTEEREELHLPTVILAGSAFALVRGAVGFYTFFLAFQLKDSVFSLGMALAASGVGTRGWLLEMWDHLPRDETLLRAVASEVALDVGFESLVGSLREAGAAVRRGRDGDEGHGAGRPVRRRVGDDGGAGVGSGNRCGHRRGRSRRPDRRSAR